MAGTTSLAEAFEHEQTNNELHLLHGVKLEIAVGFSGAMFVFICSDNRCSILRT